MRTVAIGSVVEPIATWNPRRDAAGPFRYIDLGAVDQHRKQITADRLLDPAESPSRARQLVSAGDVLVATVRPSLNGVAHVPPRLDGATASTGFCILRPSERVDSRYLFHWVRTPRFVAALTRRATGQTYPAVSDRIVKEAAMPLPDLSEQRRTAEILDRVDTLRAQREAALAEVRALTARLGEPGPPTVTVGEICQVRGGKRLPKGTSYAAARTPFRYIRVTDLRDGGIAEENLRHLDASIPHHTVATGDVIVSIAGTIGVVAVVPEALDGANLTENAARLTPREPGRYLPRLLGHLLRSDQAQEQIRRHTGQATIGKLPLYRIARLRLPLPPMDVQRELDERLAAADHLRRLHLRSLALLDDLYAALRDQEF